MLDAMHLGAIGLPAVPRVAAVLARGVAVKATAPFPPPPWAGLQAASAPDASAASSTSPAVASKATAKPKIQPAPEATAATKADAVPKAKAKAAPECAASKAVTASPKERIEKTSHTFLTDTYLFELADCKLLEAVVDTEPPKDAAADSVKIRIVLDRTVFHPQGGGQPTDKGNLAAEGLPQLEVSMVTLRREDGAVLHDCIAERSQADAWASCASSSNPPKVFCKIDERLRRLSARLHSAGHLLDAAVKAVDLRWVPGKGYHFADGPYVEYILNEESRKIDMKKPAEKDKVVEQIQANIDRLVNAGGAVSVEYKDGLRHVEMGGEECPCGGTHVKDVSEIGKVEVKKLANKQGNMRLSYQVAAAA